MEALLEEVANIRKNTVSDSSRYLYNSSNIKFLLFLLENRPDLLTSEFLDSVKDVDGNDDLRKEILKILDSQDVPPVRFNLLTATDFLAWIVSLKKKDGKPLAFSTFNTHRAALFNLYRDFRVPMSSELSEELSNYYTGLKRKCADEVGKNGEKITSGKDPLDYSLYKLFGIELLLSNKKENIFAHTFMTITWNLMCRSNNTCALQFSHLSWKEDALAIVFPKMKNDQLGERPKDAKHIYANPLVPQICPITSLGIFLLCFSSENSFVFPGSQQNER